MNRNLILVSIAVALVCAICAVIGGVFILVQQNQPTPIAQATPTVAVKNTITPAAQAPCPPAAKANQPSAAISPAPPITTAMNITQNRLSNNFPEKLVFQVDAQSNAKITSVVLVVQFADGTRSRQLPQFIADTKISATYEWRMSQNYLPPGVTGDYWWTIEDEAGNQAQTLRQSFRVEDLRRQWKKLENEKLALYWDAGGDNFGKALFDRGVQTMEKLETDTCVIVDQQVQIFNYANRRDFLEALGSRASGNEGGVTFSQFINGIVLLNVELNNLEWGKGATAHEMTHVIMHQKIQGPLGESSFPTWLDEGLAMYYETSSGALDSQFSIPLRRAIQSDTLYSIRTLNGFFRSTFEQGNQAYAEGYSIIDFIFRHYGRSKMAVLLQQVKSGGSIDDVLMRTLGVDQDGLELEWRKDVGAKPRVIPTRTPNVAPTAFPTFSLSTDATPTPTR